MIYCNANEDAYKNINNRQLREWININMATDSAGFHETVSVRLQFKAYDHFVTQRAVYRALSSSVASYKFTFRNTYVVDDIDLILT